MPTPFAALENDVFTACEAVFGEALELRPMLQAPGGGRRSPDGSRTAYDVTGIVETKTPLSTAIGATERGSSPYQLRFLTVALDRRQLTGFQPRYGDRVFRRDTGELLEIVSAPEDGEGRLLLDVKHVRRE